jgi:hypothetical protein
MEKELKRLEQSANNLEAACLRERAELRMLVLAEIEEIENDMSDAWNRI